MGRRNRGLSLLLLGAVLSAPLLTSACSEHRRVYDPYDNDYHAWNHNEDIEYHQWIVINHRADRPYKQLNKDDQKAYWEWRHNQSNQGHDRDQDHNRDRDHDHDHDHH